MSNEFPTLIPTLLAFIIPLKTWNAYSQNLYHDSNPWIKFILCLKKKKKRKKEKDNYIRGLKFDCHVKLKSVKYITKKVHISHLLDLCVH